MREIIITATEANQRLDKFLLKYLKRCPKSFLYKAMRTKKVKYNKKKPTGSEILKEQDVIALYFTEEQFAAFENLKKVEEVPISFKVAYEDNNLLIVDKPMGLLTQKDTKEGHSLADEVLYYLKENQSYSPELSKGFTPAPCNRLDRNTAGIVLVGKNLLATQALSEMLKTKQLSKYYLSIVLGRMTSPMFLKGYHLKEQGKNEVIISDHYVEGAKPVETRINPLKTNGRYTLVEVQLVTGKTHQIRAHLGQVGHPIIGDPKYGDQLENKYFKDQYGLKSQVLCAYKIKFEFCKEPFVYLQNRVFTVTAPQIYSEICRGECLI
ncbi:RNA pseudouridine synthase [Sporanaerobium hydrogeniformans]|uniref:RNA pseudouridine synthase n=1 Tax=Sporanaerobium hydrogeniformans TaxID=3072179 RepID=A0AC61DF34_9FIRM|nr:RluA family pseudouridine synthase [Sporanaerobium hydrogeniformans]PHV71820.1 RNA pseudouridine synthase [Sporanaerobium hydrogeniformans]